ncbi:MAG: AAA family ATPase [Oscillospiraceae bacterium]|jgi:predicted ATP-dependent endonuclease of OLD family|nr:AAA family ATPase [Oscillospiraceae bacterium]
MRELFITNIHIGKVRHLEDVDIALSDSERKHLILTGKNGSGKTSLLEAMGDAVLSEQYRKWLSLDRREREQIARPDVERKFGASDIGISYSDAIEDFLSVFYVYIPAERHEMTQPKAIETVDIRGKSVITRNASKDFLKYILSLYVQYLSAKDSGASPGEVGRYSEWFDNFTQALREIYECQELELKPDMKNLAFRIAMPGREPFGLHEMSDGYKAFLEIFMELILRFESENAAGMVDYTRSAIVLIDEIETHLHVELQKRALPFLTRMFPNVQFIVATHSPFVITSLSNAVVYDLEKRERLENPTFYSYESVVESFLDTSVYSAELQRYFSRYKELAFKRRTAEENEEFLRAKTELELMAPAFKELYLAFTDAAFKRKIVRDDPALSEQFAGALV